MLIDHPQCTRNYRQGYDGGGPPNLTGHYRAWKAWTPSGWLRRTVLQ